MANMFGPVTGSDLKAALAPILEALNKQNDLIVKLTKEVEELKSQQVSSDAKIAKVVQETHAVAEAAKAAAAAKTSAPLPVASGVFAEIDKGDEFCVRSLCRRDPSCLGLVRNENKKPGTPGGPVPINAIEYAAMGGHAGCFRALVEVQEEIDKPFVDRVLSRRFGNEYNKCYLVHRVAHKGHADVLDVILKDRPDAALLEDADCKNCLHVAAEYKNYDAVKVIVERNPDALFKRMSMTAWTPLHFATKAKDRKIIELLCEVGGDKLKQMKGNKGETAYDIANKEGDTELCSLLF